MPSFADKAYDSNDLPQIIADAGMLAFIPPKPCATFRPRIDATLYNTRNRIERCFNEVKHFRGFATRFDPRLPRQSLPRIHAMDALNVDSASFY